MIFKLRRQPSKIIDWEELAALIAVFSSQMTIMGLDGQRPRRLERFEN